MDKDLSRDCRAEVLYDNSQRSADQSEQVMDVSDFENALVFLDVTSYTDGSTQFQVVHSDDDSTYSEVPSELLGGDSEPDIDAGSKTGEYYIGYRGSKPYVGIKTTTTNTTSGATWEAVTIAADRQRAPQGSNV